ncbi:MAG: class I mannose-6-phosphate isomerase [Thermoflexales bacterium]|nr:class I mannose-6-phosphate isomerase [Thermoflexales bacterium]
MSEVLAPFSLQPDLKEKVWGGARIEPLLGLPQTHRRIGEAWLVHESLVVMDGMCAGRTLAEVTRQHAQALLGAQHERSLVNGQPRFPLLVKLLDPQEWLSVQVHPDDAYARAHEDVPYGKCEAWYVLHADSGAQIIHGVARPVDREALVELARSGALRDYLAHVPIQTGDVVVNLPGTIHALGKGALIYEIQQSSDITYRLYDWDRPAEAGRALHLEQSAAVARCEPNEWHTQHPEAIPLGDNARTPLVATEYFAAEHWDLRAPTLLDTGGRSPHLITVISGSGMLHSAAGDLALSPAASVVVPASVGVYQVQPKAQPLVMLLGMC